MSANSNTRMLFDRNNSNLIDDANLSSVNLLANQERSLSKPRGSQGRLSEYSESKYRSVTSIALNMTKTEKVLSEKLAYEWKNLYRNFVA